MKTCFSGSGLLAINFKHCSEIVNTTKLKIDGKHSLAIYTVGVSSMPRAYSGFESVYSQSSTAPLLLSSASSFNAVCTSVNELISR